MSRKFLLAICLTTILTSCEVVEQNGHTYMWKCGHYKHAKHCKCKPNKEKKCG